jgi:hypothetical protein
MVTTGPLTENFAALATAPQESSSKACLIPWEGDISPI